jgi:hypothetical protein
VALVHCVAVRSMERTTWHPKIIYHPGNIEHPQFGMSDSNWEQISHTADVIVHVTALPVVDHIRLYTSLRTTNVLPTKQLVRLAAPRKYRTTSYPQLLWDASLVLRLFRIWESLDIYLLLMRMATPQADGRVK